MAAVRHLEFFKIFILGHLAVNSHQVPNVLLSRKFHQNQTIFLSDMTT